jgi:hypothetical protein
MMSGRNISPRRAISSGPRKPSSATPRPRMATSAVRAPDRRRGAPHPGDPPGDPARRDLGARSGADDGLRRRDLADLGDDRRRLPFGGLPHAGDGLRNPFDRLGKLTGRRAFRSPDGVRDREQRVVLEDVERLLRAAAADRADLRQTLLAVDDLVVGPPDLPGGVLLQVEELLFLGLRLPDLFVELALRFGLTKSRDSHARRPGCLQLAGSRDRSRTLVGEFRRVTSLRLASDLQDPYASVLLRAQLPQPLAIGGVGERLAERARPAG